MGSSTTTGMYSLRICDSIREVDREGWERLNRDNVFMSYGWLKTYEAATVEKRQAKYFLLLAGTEIIAAAVGYIHPRSGKETILDRCLFGRARSCANKLGISFLPALLCGPGRGYGAHFLVSAKIPPARRPAVMAALLRGIETEAFAGCRLPVAFYSVMDSEPELIGLLQRSGYRQTYTFPYNYIDIRWNSFDAYKAYVRRRTPSVRRTINHEINRNRKAGIVIRQLEDIRGHEDRLHALLAGNYCKYNGTTFPFQRGFLGELKRNLGGDAILWAAFKEDAIVAVCLGLRKGDIIWLPMIGVDHETAGNDFTYFNTAYYRPIEDAIAWRAKRVFFGNALYRMKARRGCDIANAYIFYKPAGLIAGPLSRVWFALHASWYGKKLPQAGQPAAA